MKQARAGWLMAGPAIFHLVVFALAPIGIAFWISLHQWQLIKPDRPFIGLANYQELLGDAAFWRAMTNSGIYAVLSVPLGLATALGVALLVSPQVRAMTGFRTLFYLPAICSQVAIAMIWISIYLPKTGLINMTLGLIGLPNETDFLNQTGWAMPALVFMSIWTGLGPRMMLFLAGLLQIPTSLYEAASLDGASSSRTFWRITLPMLTPTTLFVLVTATISALQVFTPIYMMTQGGPLDETDVVGYHIFVEAWQNFQIGSASAQSFVLLAITLAISLVQISLMKRQMEGAGAA